MQSLDNSFINTNQLQSNDHGHHNINPAENRFNHRLKFYQFHFFEIIISLILTAQGIKGTYQSIKFILFDYQLLEKQFALHQISREHVNQFVVQAILLIISTMISFLFALKISVFKKNTHHWKNKVIGILMIFINIFMSYYLANFISNKFVNDLVNSVVIFLNK